jgi:phage gp36-like protein
MATAYATLADLTTYGVKDAGPFGGLSAGQQQAAVDAANATADGYLATKFKLPLSSWGADLKQKVIALARFELLTTGDSLPRAARPRPSLWRTGRDQVVRGRVQGHHQPDGRRLGRGRPGGRPVRRAGRIRP